MGRKSALIIAIAVIALAAAPALAHHENNAGKENCDAWHNDPHYGLKRDNPNDPASWVSQGDPNNPWVGSTSPTGGVYAGANGGSEGNADYSVGTCGETGNGGGQPNGGVAEVDIYEDGANTKVVVVAEGGGDEPNNDAYAGVNTGYDRPNGSANAGGPLCVGQVNGPNACTPTDTPIMCEKPTGLGGGSANWHNTTKNGCDLRL